MTVMRSLVGLLTQPVIDLHWNLNEFQSHSSNAFRNRKNMIVFQLIRICSNSKLSLVSQCTHINTHSVWHEKKNARRKRKRKRQIPREAKNKMKIININQQTAYLDMKSASLQKKSFIAFNSTLWVWCSMFSVHNSHNKTKTVIIAINCESHWMVRMEPNGSRLWMM